MYLQIKNYSMRAAALALILNCTGVFTACTPAEDKQEITSETEVETGTPPAESAPAASTPAETPANNGQVAAASTDPSLETGKNLFTSNCAMCHTLTKDRLIGPGLAGVNERRTQEWLIPWIRNSQKMVESGDKIAVELFNEYNKIVMPSYDYSDEEIKSILAYIDAEEKL